MLAACHKFSSDEVGIFWGFPVRWSTSVIDKELLQHSLSLSRETGCLRELVLFMRDMMTHTVV